MKLSVYIIFLTFLSIYSDLNGQVIEVLINNDGELTITPNSEFIAKKNIAQVNYEYSTKKPNQLIKSHPDFKIEKYDKNGNLLELSGEKHLGSTILVSHLLYQYQYGMLISSLEKDHIGYLKTFYTYSGDTTFKRMYRAEHYGPQTIKPLLDSTFINSSFFIKSRHQIKYFNKNGLHIKTNRLAYDSLKLLKSNKSIYTLSKQFIEKSLEYNHAGLVSSVTVESSAGIKTFKYLYDHTDTLERIEEWKSGRNIRVIELIYSANGWLDALIHQDPGNNHIKITKLKYTIS